MKGSAVRIRASASEKALQEMQFLTSMILWSQSCSQATTTPTSKCSSSGTHMSKSARGGRRIEEDIAEMDAAYGQ